MTRAQEIASTIQEQLGGRRFIAMTGAKDFLATGSGLRFRIPKNHSKANRVEITLNGKDLYDMRFSRYVAGGLVIDHKRQTVHERKAVDETVREYHDVYCDMLQELFTDTTWMYTHL